jgi:hypothetical protein
MDVVLSYHRCNLMNDLSLLLLSKNGDGACLMICGSAAAVAGYFPTLPLTGLLRHQRQWSSKLEFAEAALEVLPLRCASTVYVEVEWNWMFTNKRRNIRCSHIANPADGRKSVPE